MSPSLNAPIHHYMPYCQKKPFVSIISMTDLLLDRYIKVVLSSIQSCVQIFDSGLIGEGALHAVAAAQMKLLQPDATLVPSSATVYCQPLQLRRATTAAGLDVRPANCWHWRPDYEGVELGLCRCEYVPLSVLPGQQSIDIAKELWHLSRPCTIVYCTYMCCSASNT